MTITAYISQAPADRQELLTVLHGAIIANDTSVQPVIKPMMGKEMILYEEQCYMKFGLASTKNYMSFHCMPIYMNAGLHAKYAALLLAAQFQKGCINFTDAVAMPLSIVTALIVECAKVNIAVVLQNRNKKQSPKNK